MNDPIAPHHVEEAGRLGWHIGKVACRAERQPGGGWAVTVGGQRAGTAANPSIAYALAITYLAKMQPKEKRDAV